MQVDDLALARGIAPTRATLLRWNAHPGPVLWAWSLSSLAIAVLLLLAVYLVALAVPADPTPIAVVGVTAPPSLEDVGRILHRNSLVLALHAFACVAGYIAGSSLPREAERRSGVWRVIHDAAGPLAIGFVTAATLFSLTTQAFIIGSTASTVSGELGIPAGQLIVALLPHALLELWALFLPLAAWLIASRRRQWDELLAATVVTVAIAVPALVLAALVEVYMSPHLLAALLR
ncbi:MAG TPA: stage II sporulation protein M [Conexibacter sp.]|nr:stage II sporulation protein M [Conexibacter sp.]